MSSERPHPDNCCAPCMQMQYNYLTEVRGIDTSKGPVLPFTSTFEVAGLPYNPAATAEDVVCAAAAAGDDVCPDVHQMVAEQAASSDPSTQVAP